MIRTTRWLVLAAACVAVVFAACGDSEETTTTTTTTTAAPGNGGETVEVTAIDYAFVGLPATVEPGTAFTLVNESEAELHEFVAVPLAADETRSVQELLQLPPEELEALFPNVATVIIAPPGETGFPVEGDGTLTEPGRYVIICAIPQGVDPQVYLDAAQESPGGPPEIEGAGPPHFVLGMVGEVTVEG